MCEYMSVCVRECSLGKTFITDKFEILLCFILDNLWMILYYTCTRHTVRGTMYVVQCKWYNVRGTVYVVQCMLYSLRGTMYVVQCTWYNVRDTMYVVQCTWYNVRGTM